MPEFQPSPLSIDEHAREAAWLFVQRMMHERKSAARKIERFLCLAMPGFAALSPIKQWYLLKLEQDGVKL